MCMATFLGLERFSPPLSYFLASVAPLSYRPLSYKEKVYQRRVSRDGLFAFPMVFQKAEGYGAPNLGRLLDTSVSFLTFYGYLFHCPKKSPV